MPQNRSHPESGDMPSLRDIQREIRSAHNLAGRATVLSGICLILSIMILVVTLFGLDGLQENLRVLATATPEELQEASQTVVEESAPVMDEAEKLAGQLPQVPLDEWTGE